MLATAGDDYDERIATVEPFAHINVFVVCVLIHHVLLASSHVCGLLDVCLDSIYKLTQLFVRLCDVAKQNEV